jgi:hypothetical protein
METNLSKEVCVFQPEFDIIAARNQATLKQMFDTINIARLNALLELKVLAPVGELCFIKWFEVKIGSLDLHAKSGYNLFIEAFISSCCQSFSSFPELQYENY